MIRNQPLPLALSPSFFFYILGLVLVRKHKVKNQRSKAYVFFYIKSGFKAWLLLFTASSAWTNYSLQASDKTQVRLLRLCASFLPVALQSCEGALHLYLLKIHHTVGSFL